PPREGPTPHRSRGAALPVFVDGAAPWPGKKGAHGASRPAGPRALFMRDEKSLPASPEPDISSYLSVRPADAIKTTTCYMCACRCGIRVFLRDGKVRYIEGNRDHPVNRGVLCGKGSAGVMQHSSPARLTAPLLPLGA